MIPLMGGNNETSQLKRPKAFSVVQRLDTLILGEQKIRDTSWPVFVFYFPVAFFFSRKTDMSPKLQQETHFPIPSQTGYC